MNWLGKLVGGAAGLVLGGPVGAALGVLAGHLLDDKQTRDAENSKPRPPQRRSAVGTEAYARNAREAAPQRRVHHVEDATIEVEPVEFNESGGEGPQVSDPGAVADRFFQTTFEVMGCIAKSDGRVSEQDIRAARAVMEEFKLEPAQLERAIKAFNLGKQPEYNWSRAIMALRRACAGRPDMLHNFLEIQIRTAIGGSDLQGAARPLLNRIAAMLGVGGLEFARLEAVLRIRYKARGNRGAAADWNRPGTGEYARRAEDKRKQARAGAREKQQERSRAAPTGGGLSVTEAYEVLGVAASAKDGEVTKAYRRQLSRHHPDKLKSNGLPESMLEHAQQRTQQIIEAWNVIREARGIKS